MQQKFRSMWRNSFKQFLGLPAALPSYALDQIFTPTTLFSTQAKQKTRKKIKIRFGQEDQDGDSSSASDNINSNNINSDNINSNNIIDGSYDRSQEQDSNEE